MVWDAACFSYSLHVLWLDGVYGWEAGKGPAQSAAATEVTDAEVKLVRAVRDRVVQALQRRGKLPAAEGGGDDGGGVDVDDVQAELGAAAVQGRAAARAPGRRRS